MILTLMTIQNFFSLPDNFIWIWILMKNFSTSTIKFSFLTDLWPNIKRTHKFYCSSTLITTLSIIRQKYHFGIQWKMIFATIINIEPIYPLFQLYNNKCNKATHTHSMIQTDTISLIGRFKIRMKLGRSYFSENIIKC